MMNIFIPAGPYLQWGGGVDNLIYYLNILADMSDINIRLGMPRRHFIQSFLQFAKNIVKRIIGRVVADPPYTETELINMFAAYQNVSVIPYYQGTYPKELFQADIVFLVMEPLCKIERKKIIGYIPDLQHIHLPHYFNRKERKLRDIQFKTRLESCATIILNSRHTQDDIKATYPNLAKHCQFFSMKFMPLTTYFDIDQVNIDDYVLPRRYFMISNQLWMHKDHPTALRAFAALIKEQNYSDVELICTGNTSDYRNPDYFNQIKTQIEELNLNEKIRFLGFIPKQKQLAILRNTVAVIQPTLFEGGPGGGSVYESVAYGVQSIISDIEINLEIENPLVSFFKAGDYEDLSEKMKEVLDSPKQRLPIDRLRVQHQQNFSQIKQNLYELLNNIIQQNDNNC